MFPLSSITVAHYLRNCCKGQTWNQNPSLFLSTWVRLDHGKQMREKGDRHPWLCDEVLAWVGHGIGAWENEDPQGYSSPGRLGRWSSLDFCLLCFYSDRYIPAVVDHTAGLPCQGTFLLHQVLKFEREQQISQFSSLFGGGKVGEHFAVPTPPLFFSRVGNDWELNTKLQILFLFLLEFSRVALSSVAQLRGGSSYLKIQIKSVCSHLKDSG